MTSGEGDGEHQFTACFAADRSVWTGACRWRLLKNVPANELVAKGCDFMIASPGTRATRQTRPEFVTADPAVADLRTKMRNQNATFVSQLSVKSGLTSGRRDNVPTGSHRPRG